MAFAATGRPPFGEGRPEAIIYRVIHEEPDLQGLDLRLLPVVTEVMQKDPASRPQSDQVLVNAVRSAMGGQVPVGDADAMTTVALDRTWVKEPPSPTPPKTRRGRQLALIAASVVLIAAFVAGALYVAHGDKSTTLHRGAPQPSPTASTAPLVPTAPTTSSGDPFAHPPIGQWISVMESIPQGQGVSVAEQHLSDIAKSVPDAQLLNSDDYSSLRPGYYVVFEGAYSSSVRGPGGMHCGRPVGTSQLLFRGISLRPDVH